MSVSGCYESVLGRLGSSLFMRIQCDDHCDESKVNCKPLEDSYWHVTTLSVVASTRYHQCQTALAVLTLMAIYMESSSQRIVVLCTVIGTDKLFRSISCFVPVATDVDVMRAPSISADDGVSMFFMERLWSVQVAFTMLTWRQLACLSVSLVCLLLIFQIDMIYITLLN
jgi:hypothetical protein